MDYGGGCPGSAVPVPSAARAAAHTLRQLRQQPQSGLVLLRRATQMTRPGSISGFFIPRMFYPPMSQINADFSILKNRRCLRHWRCLRPLRSSYDDRHCRWPLWLAAEWPLWPAQGRLASGWCLALTSWRGCRTRRPRWGRSAGRRGYRDRSGWTRPCRRRSSSYR